MITWLNPSFRGFRNLPIIQWRLLLHAFFSQSLRYHALGMNWKLRGYLKETQRPIYSAALILPFLVLYHTGTLILHTTYINGADALIIRILSSLSVHSMFGSVLVLLACFTIWQLRTRASWKVKSGMLLFYFLESVCFALLLLFAFGWLNTHLSLALSKKGGGIADLVLYCGAGIYEELVFRGFLLGVLILAFRPVFTQQKVAIIAASLLAALLFSVFHYIGPAGDAFSLGSFIQRMLAGLYFSVLFVTRGFGATASAHAIYDIFVGIINM
jgi:membrane protease YdiL (CAAX protease family)